MLRQPPKKLIISALIILVIGFGLAGSAWYWHQARPIPSQIKRQLKFPVYVPVSKEAFILDRKSVSYNQDKQLLLFDVNGYQNKLMVTQQALPEDYRHQEFLNLQLKALQQYSTFDSASGKIHLVRPRTLGEKQLAVLTNDSTLMFVQPEKDMTKEQWQQFFDSLRQIK